jgi:hypothetical protein
MRKVYLYGSVAAGVVVLSTMTYFLCPFLKRKLSLCKPKTDESQVDTKVDDGNQ